MYDFFHNCEHMSPLVWLTIPIFMTFCISLIQTNLVFSKCGSISKTIFVYGATSKEHKKYIKLFNSIESWMSVTSLQPLWKSADIRKILLAYISFICDLLTFLWLKKNSTELQFNYMLILTNNLCILRNNMLIYKRIIEETWKTLKKKILRTHNWSWRIN